MTSSANESSPPESHSTVTSTTLDVSFANGIAEDDNTTRTMSITVPVLGRQTLLCKKRKLDRIDTSYYHLTSTDIPLADLIYIWYEKKIWRNGFSTQSGRCAISKVRTVMVFVLDYKYDGEHTIATSEQKSKLRAHWDTVPPTSSAMYNDWKKQGKDIANIIENSTMERLNIMWGDLISKKNCSGNTIGGIYNKLLALASKGRYLPRKYFECNLC